MELIEKFKSLSKESRQTILIMIFLCLMFIVGIIIRWDYIKQEVSGSMTRYVEVFDRDSTKKIEN